MQRNEAGILIGLAAAGAAAWTGTEYLLHRFLMHEARGRGLASREHLSHHADVTYFAPTDKKLLSAASTTAVVFPVANAALGRRRATAFTGGLIGMYFIYELLHRRAHTHPPATAYGRWMRRNHFDHHFGAPMRNHGVTTPVWDRLFGTAHDPGVVRVPRRMAPHWMLTAVGSLRPDLAGDYEVVGRDRLDPATVERDRVAAFANQAPEPSPV